jgi:class 3 adenylate cyclase
MSHSTTNSTAVPLGTITFLFTDLEGSTRLWEQHPDAMRDALARHDEILRQSVLAAGGHLVKTTGDGVHAAFRTARDALDGALRAQRCLLAEPWGATGPLRVRMGIHTGDAEYRDRDYYGPALNRAARLMAAAHGEQVVVSLATAELAAGTLPKACALVDLGEHGLRDLTRRERVFQLVAPGLRRDFPPLRITSPLPAGVVTFLLADAGPTGDGDDAPRGSEVDYEAVVRSAVEAHDGTVVSPRDDTAFGVFKRATDAAAAALDAHAGVAVLRLALHTGEAVERDGEYYGHAVNRAVRLRALALPGQILTSRATADLIVDELPDPAELVEYGARTLRDRQRPERVYLLLDRRSAGTRTEAAVGLDAATLTTPDRLAAVARGPFVGRDAERARLAELLARADAGEPQVVLLGGEAGVGKTALVAQLALEAEQQSALVLYGRCAEEAGGPYEPWVEALDHLVVAGGAGMLDGLAPGGLAELGRLVPAVAERRSVSPPAAGDPETQRYVLFNGVTSLLVALTAEALVVLVLDDLHWADRPTLQLVQHVVSHGRGRLLIIGTYRDTEVIEGAPLGNALANLRREPAVHRLTLTGLDRGDTVALVAGIAGHDLDATDAAFAESLRQETRGNPFFAVEVLRHLVETGALNPDERGRWQTGDLTTAAGLPDSVREVVAQRVARLGPDVEGMLRTAAVIGERFGLETLAGALDASIDDLLDRLEIAERAALVVPAGYDEFTFSHALIGHTLYHSLRTAQRGRHHRRVAETLEAGDEAPASELARHWAAAVPRDLERAVRYARSAGQQALAALAPDAALRWFEQAGRLLDEQRDPDPKLRAALLAEVGTAQRRTGDAGFRQTLLDAAERARAVGDRGTLVAAALANTRGFALALSDVDEARVAVLDAALAAVGDDDSRERARLLAGLAREFEFGDPARRRAYTDEALAVARRVGDPGTLVEVLTARCGAIRHPDTVQERADLAAEARAIAEALGDPGGAFWAISRAADTAIERADLAAFDACLAEKARLAAEIGDPVFRWMVSWQESYRQLLAGDLDAAERAAQVALTVGTEAGQPDALTIAMTMAAAVLAHRGRFQDLLDAARRLPPDGRTHGGVEAAMARALFETGRRAEAAALIDVAAADGFPVPRDSVWLSTMFLWAGVVGRLGPPAPAAVLEDELAPYADLVAWTGTTVFGPVTEALGLLASVQGRLDDADAHFARALATSRQIEAPFLVADVLAEWSATRLARRGGDDEAQAGAALREAVELARARGYGGIERRAQALLDDPKPRRRAGTTGA